MLQLAARGLTTRQIADRLVISPKTADHHIQHIYTKIGVSNRATATRWAMEHQIVAPRDGTVAAVNCREGELVQPGIDLVEIS